jgi:hypothetical protein
MILRPLITRKPTSIEWWLFKWIFLPVFGVSIFIVLVYQSVNLKECKNICASKGFEFNSYTPPNRAGVGEKCFCTDSSKATKDLDGKRIELPL